MNNNMRLLNLSMNALDGQIEGMLDIKGKFVVSVGHSHKVLLTRSHRNIMRLGLAVHVLQLVGEKADSRAKGMYQAVWLVTCHM